MDEDQTKLKNFLRFLEWTSALGLGGLGAFIFSLKQVNPVVRFEVNIWSWIVLVVSVGIGWWAIRGVLTLAEGRDNRMSSAQYGRAKFMRMTLLGVILLSGIIASFYYSLGDVSSQKRFDVAVGTGTAILFIGVAMVGFWRLVRFLERQGESEDNQDPEEPNDR